MEPPKQRTGKATIIRSPLFCFITQWATELAPHNERLRNDRIGKEITMSIQEGKAAPAFTLPDENGKSVSLKDFTGKNLVLYFYPKDNTSG